LVVLVAVQVSVAGSYLPPVFTSLFPSFPPQTIISVPVQTAVCRYRPTGALVVVVAVQVSVLGSYLPPVLKWLLQSEPPHPPQTIISLPVQTAVCRYRPTGALVVVVGVQESVPGSYLPPVLKKVAPTPPQTIISLPVQTAAWPNRAAGALMMVVGVQVSSVQTPDRLHVVGRV
jgi:hypothetical protein